jgi:hypothetical protein
MRILPATLIWVPDGAARRFSFSLIVSAHDRSNIKNYSLKIQRGLNIRLFIAFKENGGEWDTIMYELHDQGFTHRTIEHIKSLYYKVSLNYRANKREFFSNLYICLIH